MNQPESAKLGWKARLLHEFRGYWLIVAYLTLVFAAFTQYRRLTLAAYDIEYENYWIALIKAMVLGKVIMIGDALRLARGLDRRPLIYPTLYRTVIFSLFIIAFTIAEHAVKGMWKGEGAAAGVREFLGKGWHELLGSTLVIVVGLIPFFAFRELGRVMGRGKLLRMFFREGGGEGDGATGV